MSPDTHYPVALNEMQVVVTRRSYDVILDMTRENGAIKHLIPYHGSERICWDCKTPRTLCMVFSLNGEFKEAYDLCESADGI